MNVYTDGSCINNGKLNARAGIGIYFGKNDSRNISDELKGLNLSNNIAELTAIITVFKILKNEIKEKKDINIYSDSDYSIKSITLWYPNWVKKNNLEGKKNLELIKKAYKYFQKYKNVKLHHIRAHTNLKDEHSLGNEMADTLAGEAIGIKKFKYVEKNNKEDSDDNYIFTFGKYKRKSAKWVLENDSGYIAWCIDHLNKPDVVNKLKKLNNK